MKHKHNQLKYATVFISSTFADMKSERDLIMYSVFPKVKSWALKRGIIFDILDLRWGINENQEKSMHHTMRICLQRVKECDPLFVCLLGERYGWIPDAQDFNQSMFEKDIAEYIGASATELEIMQALHNAFFDSPEKSCVFLFRDALSFDGVEKDVIRTYADETNDGKLKALKGKIEEENAVIRYSAEFQMDDDNATLGRFQSNGLLLEEVLTEKIIKILRDRYGIDEENQIILDDPIVHQQFFLKQLALTPKIEHCCDKMHEFLKEMPEHLLRVVYLNQKHSIEHQVAHFIQDEQKKTYVIYRFMGIDQYVKNESDLIKSIAYEVSGEHKYLGDLRKAVLFLKKWFERTNKKITLIVANIDEKDVGGYLGVLRGFKIFKAMLFVNTNELYDEYHVEYDKTDFALLARNMLHTKAKSLLPNQLETLLGFVRDDYRLLKTAINYLCTFASYENVGDMIAGLEHQSKITLTKIFLDRMFEVQDSHPIGGVMRLVIELLCFTPFPVTRSDIVETIKLYRHTEQLSADKLEKEIDFSLCFAKDFIEEYNSRFIINDSTIREIFGAYLVEAFYGIEHTIQEGTDLVYLLLYTYMRRIMELDSTLDRTDIKTFAK